MVDVCKLQELALFQLVTVEVKAGVDDCMEVAGGKRKQDILVGDASGSVRLTVWEAEVGKVK